MIARVAVLSLLLSATTLIPNPAHAALIQFCITHTGAFTDNNHGEDYWTDDLAKPALGQWAFVGLGNEKVWEGFLSTSEGAPGGQGCTPWIDRPAPNASYIMVNGSEGKVGGSPIEVWDTTSAPSKILKTWTTFNVTDGGAQGTYRKELVISDPAIWDTYNIYLAVAYAVWRMPGIPPGSLYKIHYVSSGCCYHSDTQTVWIPKPDQGDTGWPRRKFLILHEVGHHAAWLATQGVMNGAHDYRWYDPECPRDVPADNACDEDGDLYEDGGSDGTPVPGICINACLAPDCARSSHSMRSMEFVGSAVGEGFAHFFAAAVWNDQSLNADCKFRYYNNLNQIPPTQTVDCEHGSGGMEAGYMQFTCSDPDISHGVELDWLRAFWDMRTNYNAFGAPPSFVEMLTWMDNTLPWEADTALTFLDNRAPYEGLRLYYAWSHASTAAGVPGDPGNEL